MTFSFGSTAQPAAGGFGASTAAAPAFGAPTSAPAFGASTAAAPAFGGSVAQRPVKRSVCCTKAL